MDNECICGKNGYPLNATSCPVHGSRRSMHQKFRELRLAVEHVGAHELLTDAVVLLTDAEAKITQYETLNKPRAGAEPMTQSDMHAIPPAGRTVGSIPATGARLQETILDLLQSPSCFGRGQYGYPGVCAKLPCACAESISDALRKENRRMRFALASLLDWWEQVPNDMRDDLGQPTAIKIALDICGPSEK